ncbi:Coatomer subunit delta [Seminavis robusta]|uniref:Coatomer subunit delta n=1 Tax=Seminavis robusta TaxID=568900 RepID=A0A9N8DD82_9STRA|nr:Coatomer subunit delta [Seminavis robusta]|eukprot:Sro88_g046670.1 Coatomer subunit delta (549) ;mRNA; r:95057-97191
MVVLSASVCTRQGKALVSRQFVEMNRLRVEGLLAAFPKLAGHGGKQHTYVETDSVRYVYQPLENQIYLLLITTKTSNIVEDLGTLRLLAKVVPDVAGGLQEQAINDNAFELIFAFDEVLTTGGYKEEVSLSTIRANLLMDSHEEKIHMALKQSKEEQARDEMRRQAKTIKERQMAQLREGFIKGGTGSVSGGMQGFGGGGVQPGGQSFLDGFDSGLQQQQEEQQQNDFAPSGFDPSRFGNSAAQVPSAPKVIAKGGMKLGGLSVKRNDQALAAMAAEDNLLPLGGGKANLGDAFGLGAPVQKAVAAPSTPLTLVLEEKITAQMNREGGVESCEVKGTLTLTANTDVGAMAVVSVNKAQIPKDFNVATHPKVDKKTYAKEGKLMLKGGSGFPISRPVGILRWSYGGEDAAPLSINCWPEDEGNGAINVNIEMELTRTDLVLQDVNILLPLGTTDPPVIESIDGVYKHDARSGMMCWHFDQVSADSNSTASLEFRIGGANTEAFFPVQIGFRSETLLCPIQIVGVTNSQNGTVVPNQMTKNFGPEVYQCT